MGILKNIKDRLNSHLPTFIILGAQKGGTSSLHKYLSQHPQIFMSEPKETHFFSLFYDRGIPWYKSHFVSSDKNHVHFGETTPYYLFHPYVPKLVKKHVPNAKFIVLLRDPVVRAYSHFNMEQNRGFEKTALFKEAIEIEENRIANGLKKVTAKPGITSFEHQTYSYISRGKYAEQIERWFLEFPREQFLFLRSEDFFSDSQKILDEVYHFLSVKPFSNSLNMENVGEYSPLSSQEMEKYRTYFKEDQQKLINLIGTDFTW